MSTRGTIIINNEDRKRVIAIYKHCDCYIHRGGLGATIFEFMKDRILVNGYGMGRDDRKIQVNGLGDLGAQLVTELKGNPESVGNTYIMEEGEEIHGDVEYIYYITPVDAEPCPMCGHGKGTNWEIKIIRHDACIFTGTPEEAIYHFGRNPEKPLY